ncbi:MAG: hypothetical protein WBL50_18890 [Candidatus Acidiferrum sp.]
MKKVGSRGRSEQRGEQHRSANFRSDSRDASEQAVEQAEVDIRRSELRNGLTRRQRILAGLNDKDAALAAGYSLSVAENTKQRIWNRWVIEEFQRLTSELVLRIGRENVASHMEK